MVASYSNSYEWIKGFFATSSSTSKNTPSDDKPKKNFIVTVKVKATPKIKYDN